MHTYRERVPGPLKKKTLKLYCKIKKKSAKKNDDDGDDGNDDGGGDGNDDDGDDGNNKGRRGEGSPIWKRLRHPITD